MADDLWVFAASVVLVHTADTMKHPVVVTGSILLCLMIIISAALIGLIALNGSRLEESTTAYDE